MRALSFALSLSLVAGVVAVAGCTPAAEPLEQVPPVKESAPLPPGEYPIQTLLYDDADGAYRAFLLNAPPSLTGPFVSKELRMARLTDEEVAAGGTAKLVVEGEGPVAKLPANFAIQYTHNVTEEMTNPSTGRTETVVVRQETSTWSPFMSAMAGMAVANMLFSPMYYYPPPYVMGSPLVGSGGYGATRVAAQQSFQQNHGSLPQSTKLSQSGFAKKPSASMKATGSGAGSSRLTKPSTTNSRPKSSFGSGFGRRRR